MDGLRAYRFDAACEALSAMSQQAQRKSQQRQHRGNGGHTADTDAPPHTATDRLNPGDTNRLAPLLTFPALTELAISDGNAAGHAHESVLPYVSPWSLTLYSLRSTALLGMISGARSLPMRNLEAIRIDSYAAQDAATMGFNDGLLGDHSLTPRVSGSVVTATFLSPHLSSSACLEPLEIGPRDSPSAHSQPPIVLAGCAAEPCCDQRRSCECDSACRKKAVQWRAHSWSELVRDLSGRLEITSPTAAFEW